MKPEEIRQAAEEVVRGSNLKNAVSATMWATEILRLDQELRLTNARLDERRRMDPR